MPVRFLQRTELDRMAGNAAHQGVVAVTSAKQYSDLDDVVGAKRGQYSLRGRARWRGRSAQSGGNPAHCRRRGSRRRRHSRTPRRPVYRDRDQSFRRSERAFADCQSHEHRAHGGRTERAQYLDGWARRTRQANLRRARLQHGLRAGAGRRRQGSARSGEEEVRFPGFDSDAGEGSFAECFGRGGGRAV